MFVPGATRAATFAEERKCVSRVAARLSLLLLCGLIASYGVAQTNQSDDQPAKISGTVINSVTKVPITRALVFTSDNRLAVLTDGEGHFELTFPRNNAGSGVTVFSSGGDGNAGCSSWLQARKPGYLECIASQPGSSNSDLTIALVPEALIHGRVSVGNSEPLSGTDVQLFYRDVVDGEPRWIPRHDAKTNSAGEFRFAEPPAGEYKLLTRDLKGEAEMPNISAGTYDVRVFGAGKQYVIVGMSADGAQVKGHSVTLPAGASASVALTLALGTDVQGVAKNPESHLPKRWSCLCRRIQRWITTFSAAIKATSTAHSACRMLSPAHTRS